MRVKPIEPIKLPDRKLTASVTHSMFFKVVQESIKRKEHGSKNWSISAIINEALTVYFGGK